MEHAEKPHFAGMTLPDYSLTLPPSWPEDNLLNAFLAEDPSLFPYGGDYTTSSSDSDLSPLYSSPFSSPSTPSSPDSPYQTPSTQVNTYAPSTESLDAIIQQIIHSDVSYGYNRDVSGPSLKKRKLEELDAGTPFEPAHGTTYLTSRVKCGEKFFLTREQLIQVSSAEFDEYRKILISRHKISAEEKDLLKSQRRIIKNREYSQNCRQKKRERVEILETRIQELETANSLLQEENNTLKENLQKIVGAYQKSKVASTPVYTYDTILPAPSHPKISGTSMGSLFTINAPSLQTPTSKATGACLFIILLSFGFLFTLSGNQGFQGDINSRSTGRIILSSDDVSPSWWDSVYSHISETITAAENTRIHSSQVPSMSFVTTVTTNVGPTSSIPVTPLTWDDTHVCDYDLSMHHQQNQNQTILLLS